MSVVFEIPAKILAPILVALISLPSVANAANLELLSEESNTKDSETIFLDTNSISTQGSIIRVWAQSFPTESLDAKIHNKFDKTAVVAVMKKMDAGYVPPIVRVRDNAGAYANKRQMRDDIIEVATKEYYANNSDIRLSKKIYWTIDCSGKRIGSLSFATFDKAGDVKNTVITEYPSLSSISPGSIGESIAALICPSD